MTPTKISPQDAKRLVDEGAVLIDIRGPAEHARESIPGAHNWQPGQALNHNGSGPLVFHCRSGGRTGIHADSLAAAAKCEAYILDGGIDAWKRAGYPVRKDDNQPIELVRQVQIAAGGLVLLGVLIGVWITPAGFLFSGLIAAGLVVGGITGSCGIAKLLGLMPWNRRAP